MVLEDITAAVLFSLERPLIRALVIVGVTVVVAAVFDRVLARHLSVMSRRMEVSTTSSRLIRRLLHVGIYIIGIGLAIYTIPGARQLSLALFASAGFIGIVLGFAAQQSLSNLLAGIMIAIYTPFRVGDKIETQTHYGTVEDITLRQTLIQTPSNERVVVPNAKILDDYIVNYSLRDEKSRFPIQVQIGYWNDIDTAKQIMLEAADAHPLTDKGESQVIVTDLADSGVVLELRIWSHDRADAWKAGQDLRETIKKRFDDEDITIPFPQRTMSDMNDFTSPTENR